MRNPIAFNLVDNVPVQLRADYPKFFELLRKFYLWLDSGDNYLVPLTSLRENMEVNLENSPYIDAILSELGWDNSLDIKISKKLLVATLRDFYLSRGTEWSYQYLFKIIYNEDVSFDYSKNKLFRTSNSVYSKDFWILASSTSFGTEAFRRISDPLVNNNRIITGKISRTAMNGSEVIATFLDSERFLKIMVNDNLSSFTPNEEITISLDDWKITEKIYNSITFSITSPGVGYQVGDPVKLSPSNAVVVPGKARVRSVLTGSIDKITIVDGGVGYTAGTLIKAAENTGGVGFIAAIYAVDSSTGGITSVIIWSPGAGYSKIPALEIQSTVGSGAILVATSSTIGGIESVEITEPFWGTTNTAKTVVVESATGTGAVIRCIENSCISSTSSSFKDSSGFLGVNGVLTDDWYWQEHSYQLKSSLNRSQYDKLIRDHVHPIGTVCHSIYQKETHPDLNLKLVPSKSLERPQTIFVPVDTELLYKINTYLDISRSVSISKTLIGTLNTIDPFKFENSFAVPIAEVLPLEFSTTFSVRFNWALPVQITQSAISP